MSLKRYLKKLSMKKIYAEPLLPPEAPVEEQPIIPPAPDVSQPEQIVQQPAVAPEGIGGQPEVPIIPTEFSEPWVSKRSKKTYHFLNVLSVPLGSELAKALEASGYKYNKRAKRFSKSADVSNVEEIENELQALSVQFGVQFGREGLDAMNQFFTPETPSSGQGDLDDLGNALKHVDKTSGDATDKVSKSKKAIDKWLDELANNVDEAYKGEVIQKFLDFTSKMYNYSFLNTILIWFQKRDATRCQSKTNWAKMGRQPKEATPEVDPETGQPVVDPETGQPAMKANNPLIITRPDFKRFIFKSNVNILLQALRNYPFQNGDLRNARARADFLDQNNINKFPYTDFVFALVYNKKYGGSTVASLIPIIEEMNNNAYNKKTGVQWKAVSYETVGRATKFVDANTWDVSQTEPIPGFPPDKVFDPDAIEWQSQHNTPDENLTMLVNAANSFASEKGIKIDFEADTGRAGGWSRGSEIAISKMSEGLRRFSTTVHEITHSLLHFDDNSNMVVGDRTLAETEAESTVFVVLKHFGADKYDPNAMQFAANYIALKTKGDKEAVFAGFDHVRVAAGKIIEGIEKHQMKTAKNWFKRVKFAKFINSIEEY
jgi:hypothetical protein